MADPVLVRVDGGLAWVTLNRPEARNAVDDAMREALLAAFARVADNPGIRAAVLGSFAVLHAGIALMPVTLLESEFDASAVLGDGVRLFLVLMTIVACGCLLLRLPLPAGSAPWVLGVGAFVVPLLQARLVPDHSLGLLACALLSAGWLLDHPPGRTT